MTTTPPGKRPSSSASPMTDFKNGLGQDIPAEAFENDIGPPRKPALSDEALKKFDEETAAMKAAIGKG